MPAAPLPSGSIFAPLRSPVQLGVGADMLHSQVVREMTFPRRRAALVGLVASVALGCQPSTSVPRPPSRDCAITVWHRPARAGAQVSVVAGWDGWRMPGTALPDDRDDGWRTVTLAPPPGEQEYAILEDGAWLTDANVGTTAFHDGHEVTWIRVASCDAPAISIDGVTTSSDGRATIRASFLASSRSRHPRARRRSTRA
jgi:hypothetical protein